MHAGPGSPATRTIYSTRIDANGTASIHHGNDDQGMHDGTRIQRDCHRLTLEGWQIVKVFPFRFAMAIIEKMFVGEDKKCPSRLLSSMFPEAVRIYPGYVVRKDYKSSIPLTLRCPILTGPIASPLVGKYIAPGPVSHTEDLLCMEGSVTAFRKRAEARTKGGTGLATSGMVRIVRMGRVHN